MQRLICIPCLLIIPSELARGRRIYPYCTSKHQLEQLANVDPEGLHKIQKLLNMMGRWFSQLHFFLTE